MVSLTFDTSVLLSALGEGCRSEATAEKDGNRKLHLISRVNLSRDWKETDQQQKKKKKN